MIEAKQMKQINFKARMESFVIRLGKEAEILIFSFNFKLMYMENVMHHLTTNDVPNMGSKYIKYNKEKKMNNNLKNVPYQNRWHLNSHPHNNPFAITQNNNLPKLPSSLKHDDFVNKFAKANEYLKQYYFLQKNKTKMNIQSFLEL
jgi:hypothetical protein